MRFDHIPIVCPYQKILNRLRFVKGVTTLDTAMRQRTEAQIRAAFGVIALRGSAVRLPLLARSAEEVTLEGQFVLHSSDVAGLLREAVEVLLIGCTAGERIIDTIREESARDLTRGVIYDATASEAVDAAAQWICDYAAALLRRENRRLGARRFSPGYGDLALSHQRLFAAALGLADIGVRVTEACVLVPEKSVTALIAVEPISR